MAEVEKVKNKKAAQILVLVGIILIVSISFLAKSTETIDENGEIIIETGYCDLYYPARWQKNVEIQQVDDTVQFQADIKGYETQPLFDIHFGSTEGAFCGMLLEEDGTEVSVSLTVYPLEQVAGMNQEQLDMLYGMQEDLNYLCAKLPLTDAQETVQTDEEQAYSDIEIETPYGQLRYPGMWEEYLRLNVVEKDAYTVEFYANVEDYPEQHLFNIRLRADADGQFQVHTESGDVYSLDIELVLLEVDDTWGETEANILYGMLEGLNYLIESLNTAEE